MDRIHLSSPSNTYTADSNDTPYKRGREKGGKNSRDPETLLHNRSCTFGQLSQEFEIFRKLATAFPRVSCGLEGDDYVNSTVGGEGCTGC